MKELASRDRTHLKGLAHGLDPVVQVGSAGFTPEAAKTVFMRCACVSAEGYVMPSVLCPSELIPTPASTATPCDATCEGS